MNRKVTVVVLIAFVCFNVARAGLGFGRCPGSVQAMKNFNLTKFEGHWYEFSSYDSMLGANEKCVQCNSTLRIDGNITIFNSAVDKKTLETEHIRGKAKLADDSGDAKFEVQYPVFRGIWREIFPFWVLETDYENYALAYTCVDYFILHLDDSWVLSRSTSLEDAQISKLERVMKNNGLNPSQFKRQVQDCGDITLDIVVHDFSEWYDESEGECSGCCCGLTDEY